MTSESAAVQHLRDLARPRRVRDRIDREHAQPLNVEAPATPEPPACLAKQATTPIRKREAPATEPQLA